jgi:coenzyme F420-0:L-glutamate ligase/coenzyme F420-1:gamma-L-glutamate ligase
MEGRIVEIDKVKPSERALKIASVTGRDPRIVELVLGESKCVLKVSPQTMIVEDKRSIVNINAGLDKSNVQGENRYALLPEDPDKSARGLRLRIEKLTGRKVGVIICDTYSRPFRRGQVNFAIGLGGIEPFVDYRGESDLFGYTLQVKFTAVADELASAAELVMGQGSEAVPVAVIKGFNYLAVDESFSSNSLIISEDEDLFKNVL